MSSFATKTILLISIAILILGHGFFIGLNMFTLIQPTQLLLIVSLTYLFASFHVGFKSAWHCFLVAFGGGQNELIEPRTLQRFASRARSWAFTASFLVMLNGLIYFLSRMSLMEDDGYALAILGVNWVYGSILAVILSSVDRASEAVHQISGMDHSPNLTLVPKEEMR